jgi:hypothetical protein
MEPLNKKSPKWREWFVRHHFGATTVELAKIVELKELRVFKSYLIDMINKRRGENGR